MRLKNSDKWSIVIFSYVFIIILNQESPLSVDQVQQGTYTCNPFCVMIMRHSSTIFSNAKFYCDNEASWTGMCYRNVFQK